MQVVPQVRDTIIVVEDYPPTLRAWKRAVVHESFRAIAAPSVDAAAAALDAVAPTAIAGGLIDISVGGRSGLVIAERLRRDAPYAPIAVCSAYLERYQDELARLCVEQLEKPVSTVRIEGFLQHVAAAAAVGPFQVEEAVAIVAKHLRLPTRLIRVLSELVSGTAFSDLGAVTGFPQKTIETWLWRHHMRSGELRQLVERVRREGRSALASWNEGLDPSLPRES